MPSLGRPSLVLLVALLSALAFGAAASLLIGAATSPGAPPVHPSELVLPDWVIGDSILAAAVVFTGFLIVYRFRQGTASVPGRLVSSTLVAILILVLFIVAARFIVGGGPNPAGIVAAPGQNTTTVPGNNSTVNATIPGSGVSSFLFWSPALPPWLPFLVIVAVLLAVVAIAGPLMGQYLMDRRELRRYRPKDSRQRVAAEVQGALARAAEDLDQGGDPRTIIVALYATVLARLAPLVGAIDVETPEEIRTQHLVRLGIRPSAATVLTRLFEEARYSSHPLASDAAETARRAVREALADLARTSVPA